MRFTRRKKDKLRELIALAISRAPFNWIRVSLYRVFFRYEIHASRIGFGTTIDVDSLSIDHGYIGPFCRFVGPMRVHIHPNVRIGRQNIFNCGSWTVGYDGGTSAYRRELLVGEECEITDGHYFDVAGLCSLGARSRVAGYGSQFWTHGAGVVERDVHIGKECFIGSAARFAPGSEIGNRCVVAMGSVVSGTLLVDDALIAGVPAVVKQAKPDYAWRSPRDADR